MTSQKQNLDVFRQLLDKLERFDDSEILELISQSEDTMEKAKREIEFLNKFLKAKHPSTDKISVKVEKPPQKKPVSKRTLQKKPVSKVVPSKKTRTVHQCSKEWLMTIHQAIIEGTNNFSALNKKLSDLFPETEEGQKRLRSHIRRLVREKKIKFQGSGDHGFYKSIAAPGK